ncbi:MAG: DUF1049 domain-containing protein [Acidobacteria bacterium]|nr:DUF1049 domain-containing protein [Acidobacteriota bacterium]
MTMEPESRHGATEPRNGAQSGRSGPSAGLVGAVLFGIIVLIFAIGNGDETRINFLLFKWDTTVRFAILIAVVLGIVLDRLFNFGMKRRKKRKLKEQLREID